MPDFLFGRCGNNTSLMQKKKTQTLKYPKHSQSTKLWIGIATLVASVLLGVVCYFALPDSFFAPLDDSYSDLYSKRRNERYEREAQEYKEKRIAELMMREKHESKLFFKVPLALGDGISIDTLPFSAGILKAHEPQRNIVHIQPQKGDMSGLLNSIIESDPGPLEILLGEGVYHLHSNVNLRTGVVIRGEGKRKTILYLVGDAEIRMFGSQQNKVALDYSIEHGTQELIIDDAANTEFTKGNIVRVGLSLPEYVFEDKDFDERNYQHRGQVFLIEETSNDKLIISPEVRLHYPKEFNPFIQRIDPIRFAGIENLTIETDNSPQPTYSLRIEAAHNCWVKNVEFSHSRKSHIWVTYSKNLEFTGNYIHHGWRYDGEGGLYGYGISLANSTSDCLVSDNVFESLRHAIILSRGASGNVISYNYSTKTNPQNNHYGGCDIDIHGYYANGNLIEGNDIHYAYSSAWFGHAGPLIIFHRNRINGDSGRGILISKSNFSIVTGNQIIDGTIEVDIGALGVKTIANETKKKNGILRFDIGVDIEYEPDNINLPSSLYSEHKPEVLGDTRFPPFGPDVDNENKLPAQIRYEEIYSKWSQKYFE